MQKILYTSRLWSSRLLSAEHVMWLVRIKSPIWFRGDFIEITCSTSGVGIIVYDLI